MYFHQPAHQFLQCFPSAAHMGSAHTWPLLLTPGSCYDELAVQDSQTTDACLTSTSVPRTQNTSQAGVPHGDHHVTEMARTAPRMKQKVAHEGASQGTRSCLCVQTLPGCIS